MTVRVNKPSFNIREKLSELGRKFGLKGSELAAAETVQEARDVVSAGRKNMIINGAMQVAQRVAYPSTQPSVSYSNYYTVDRWRMNISDAHFGTWTFSQSNTVPSGKGFAYSWKWDCQATDTSLSSDHYGIAEYRIEAQDLQHLGYGTSSAKPITLSFWVKTNKTGTYVFSIYANDGARYVTKTYTVNQANTWEYKTITFEGDISGTINNDNGDGFRLWWWLGSGTGYTGGTMQPGVWRPWSESNGAAPGLSVNMADSTSNEWFITGVQLEVGRNATEFEHRSYGEELALCQRYYYEYPKGNTYNIIANGFANTSSNALFHFQFPVPMRTAPGASTTGNWQVIDGTSHNVTGFSATTDATTLTGRVDATTSGLTVGRGTMLRNNNDASARFSFNAEL
jgi:hypothetical protein|tara:strand:+ start:101 stop:1291 length:1191 start_codon:yes stop_codon:yes gene_type:complete